MENDEKLSAAPAATITSANSSFDGYDFSNKLNGNLQSALVPYQKINGNVFSATPTININNNNHSSNNNNNENKGRHEEEEVDDEGEVEGEGGEDSSSSSNELVIDQDAENSSDSNDYDEDESSLDEDEGNDTTNLKRPNSFDTDYLGNFQSTKRIKKNAFDNDNNDDDDNIESDIESTTNKFSYDDLNMLINKFRMNGGETNSIKEEPVSPSNDENYKSRSPSPSLSRTPSPSPPPAALSSITESSEETPAERIVHNLDSNFGIRSDKRNDGVVSKKSVDKDIDFSNIKNIHNSMLSNRRKVFLCSTCGTYYENWNLFLHMREIHKKHLCLFCLGIFRNGERLSLHLENKHNVRRKYFNTSVELVRNYLKPSQVITGTENNLIGASQPPTFGTSSVNKSSSLFLMCCQCEHVFDNDDDDSDESTGYKNHNCEKYMKKCKDCGDAFPHKYYCKHKNQQTPKKTKSMNNTINIYSSSSHNSSSSSDSNSNSFNKISQGAVKNTKNINSIVNKGKNMNNYINMDSSNPYSGLDDIDNDDNVTVLPATQTTLLNPHKASGKDNSFKQLFSNHKPHDNESFTDYEDLNSNENSGKAIELSNKNGKNRKRIQNDTMSSQNISINTFDQTIKNVEKQNTNICANNFNSEENSLSKSFDEAEDMPKLLVPKLKVKIPIKFQNTPIESEESSTSSDDEAEAEDAEFDEEDDDDYDEDDEDININDDAPDDIEKEEKNTVVDEESQNEVERAQIEAVVANGIREDIEEPATDNISNSIDTDTSNIAEAGVKPIDNHRMVEEPSEVNLTESTIENKTLPVEEIKENDPVKDNALSNTEMEITPDTNGPTDDTDNADNSEMDIEEIKHDDGIALAGSEVPIFELSLNKPLNKFEILEFMRICLQATIPICLYCNHARKIAVSAQSLALHILANHRFEAIVDSITAEELLPETIVIKLKSSILTEEDRIRMESIYFNSDTYDSSAIEKYDNIPFDKLYECFQCRFVTYTHKELYLHNRKLHQKTIIICQMCDQQFYSYSELLCHMCPGVPNKFIILDYKYRCCLCSLDNITSAFRLMVHLRKKHFACDVCLEACFDQSRLSNHVWKHKLHHVCYRCGIAYRNKVDITKHLFWKHGTESVVCKRCLQKKWPHVYHFCIPPVQFICETCNLIFKRAVSLKVHKRLHTGDAPYPCTEDNCEKKFISRKLLLKHVARHTAQIDEITNQKALEIKREVDDEELIDAKDTPVFEVKSEKDDDNKKSKDDDSKKSEAKASKKKSKKSKNENKSKNNILDLMKNLQPVNLSESDSSDESENDVTTPVVIITENDTITKDIALSPKPATDTESSVDVLENPEAVASDGAVAVKESEGIVEVEEAVSNEKDTTVELTTEADKAIAAKEVEAVEEVNEAEEVTNKPVPVPDIWDNFKSYQAIHKKSEDGKEDDENKNEDDVKEPSLIHVVQSDHDYSSLYDKTKKDKSDDAAKSTKEIDEISPSNMSTPSKKKSGKSPKKTKNSESSSSDSSSDSDSSCSCGPNCSCSSSSSSNSSSSSDDSDSSNDEDETPKKNKKLPVDQKPSVRPIPETIDVVGSVRAPVYIDPDTIIIESDLETDESETDEDFYDEHPQKLANQLLEEKRQQLMMQTCMNPLNNYGIVENSRPSTPSLPEEVAIKKKVKVKKKKKDRKTSKNPSALKPDIPISGIVNQMDNFASFMPKQEHVAAVMTPSPNILSPAISLPGIHPSNSLLPQAAASIKSLDENRLSISSESDAALKRSKRRRIPNKFYGYCSDDDSTTTSLTPAGVAAFKPTAPPVLTWCKEDLPSPPNSLNNPYTKDHDKKSANKVKKKSLKKLIRIGNKVPAKKYKKKQEVPLNLDHSAISSNAYQPPIPPVIIRPNLISMAQPPRVEPIRIPAVPVQVINLAKNDAGYSSESNDDSDSSDEGTLQINQEPIKKKLPKLKLSTLSNRKISKKMEEVINEQLPRPSQSLTQQYQEKQQQMLIQLQKNKQEFLIANQQKLQMPPITLNGGNANVPGIANSITPNMMTSSMIQQQQPQSTEMKTMTPAQQAYHSIPHIPESVYQSNQIRLPIMPPAGCRPAREGESVYCYCRCPYDEVSEMIACDGSNCSIEWFHFECVNIIMPPKGKWYCPECLPKYVDSNGIPYQTVPIIE